MQTVHMKLIEAVYMTTTGDPRLPAVQQGSNDYSCVDSNFCAKAYMKQIIQPIITTARMLHN